jgi:hypothetical protein
MATHLGIPRVEAAQWRAACRRSARGAVARIVVRRYRGAYKDIAMDRISLLAVLLVTLMAGGAAPAGAADMSVSASGARPAIWRFNRPGKDLPFPRDARAQAVWGERACWSHCQSFCTWGEAACLTRDPQGHCLTLTDRCDRACQRDCRSRGGPLVLDIFDF